MFISRKKKLQAYLNGRSTANNVFDILLGDYLSGNLKKALEEFGITRIDFCID